MSSKRTTTDMIERIEQFSKNLNTFIKQRTEPFRFDTADAKSENAENQKSFKSTSRHRSKVGSKERGSSKSKRKDSEEFQSSKRKSASLKELEEEEESIKHQVLPYQPKCIKNCIMKDYQIRGLNWMIDLYECQANGILADQMGLGKTLQSISFLAYLSEVKNDHGPHLVIAPLSVTRNWESELNKFYPGCKSIILSAKQEFRDDDIREYTKHRHNVIICSYNAVESNIKFLRRQPFSQIVLDEAHRIKNDESLFSNTINKISSRGKLLLTGTPLSNDIMELWSLLQYLMPQIFTSKEVFQSYFCALNTKSGVNSATNSAGLSEQDTVKKLHELMAPFVMRRLKQDTNLNLPEKKEILLYCPLTSMQRGLYKTLLASSIQAKNLRSGNLLMDLRKAAIHPYLFPQFDTEDDEFGDHLITNSGKFIILDKLIQKLVIQQNEKILIFSQFSMTLNILEDYFVKKELSTFRLDGSTEIEERVRCMDEFNSDQLETKVFLLSTRAGGLGITLIASRYVILLDSDWNPQVDLQAMDRVHRIGQTRPVSIFRLITKNTIEEKIHERQTIKLKLDYLVVERGRQINKDQNIDFQINSLSEQELKDLTFFGASNVLNVKEEDCENIDIDKLLEEGEKAAEKIAKTLEDKVKEYTNKATDFNYESKITIFEGEDFREKGKGEDQEAVRKMLMENLQKMNKVLTRNAPRIKKQYKMVYKCHIEAVPYFYFMGKDGVRLTELRRKEDKYLFYRYKSADEIPEGETVEEITEEEKEELALLNSKIRDVTQREFQAFMKGVKEYGRHNLEDIRKEMLPGWSNDFIYDYACRFWRDFETIPNYEVQISKIDQEEYKKFKTVYYSLVLESAFGNFNSCEDILLPLGLQKHLLAFDLRSCDESIASFMLFYHSRLLSDKHAARDSLKSLMLRHECLKTDFISLGFSEKELHQKLDKIAARYMSFYEILPPAPKSNPQDQLPYDFESHHSTRKNGSWLWSISLEVSQAANDAIEKMRLLGGIFSHLSCEEDKLDKNKLRWLADSKRHGRDTEVFSKTMNDIETKHIANLTIKGLYNRKHRSSEIEIEEARSDDEDKNAIIPTMQRESEFSNAQAVENSNTGNSERRKRGRRPKVKPENSLFNFGIKCQDRNVKNKMDIESAFEEEFGPESIPKPSSSSNTRVRSEPEESFMSNSLAVSSSQINRTAKIAKKRSMNK